LTTLGDRFMASFDSATSAVECTIGLQRSFATRNNTAAEPMLVRVGLNSGEPIEEDVDLFGTAVTFAM
jgi:adenylate cyclase